MNKSIFALLAVTFVLVISGCSNNLEKKLLGTWKVVDVHTEFNESEVTPEMLRQVVEMQKQTYFRIVNDSTMVIISSNNTHEAKWTIDNENMEITYFFNGMETVPNVLGKFEENHIVSESNTPLGSMIIYYEKE